MTGKTSNADERGEEALPEARPAPVPPGAEIDAFPLGRNREEPPGKPESAPGPRFPSPPPAHPVLSELHALWISANADTIGSIVNRARAAAEEAPPEIHAWVVRYVEALERLEFWLRDF